MHRRKLMRASLCAIAAVVLSGVAGATPAQAAFGLSGFDGAVLDENGQAYTQAGGHPATAAVSFSLNRRIHDGNGTSPPGAVYPDGGELKNAVVDLPAGFLGNPTAVTQCPRDRRIPSIVDAQFPGASPATFCPRSSIVGRVVATANQEGVVKTIVAPVFNLEPPPGVAAQFAFSVAEQKTFLDALVRNDGDYGVSVRVRNVSQGVPVLGSTVTLWGIPASTTHDDQRCLAFEIVLATLPTPNCNPDSPDEWLRPSSIESPPVAFITNPTQCTPPGIGLETRIAITSWMPGVAGDQASFITHEPPGFPLARAEWGPEVGVTGCENLPFSPGFEARPDTSRPDAPMGLAVDVTMDQESLLNPFGRSPAHLRRVSVAFSEGVTVNPSSAHGLQACSDEQLAIGQPGPAACPEASKIGTVTAETPLLAQPLAGDVYVGSQKSDDPESGDLFRVFMSLNNPDRGVAVKLRGNVRANAQTGRLEAIFDNNPQVPVSRISLRLKSGDRAPLATPQSCGAKTVGTTMTSWGGQVANPGNVFNIDCGAGGFAPGFSAGGTVPVAGAFSPFTVDLSRADGDQFLKGVGVELTGGLLAKLRGVTLCGDAQAAAGTCPLSSRVGTATAGAGAGGHPYFVNGTVSLTGPYRGGPYGLSVAIRAAAGPFDLGMVVVRQAIYVDPTDGHLKVVSDPLPTIVKGVPLRVRAVRVAIDRPGFTTNPTSCAAKQLKATLLSEAGGRADRSQRFVVDGCRSLGFKPKLSMRLTGKGQTTGGDHPGLESVLTQPTDQAHIRDVKVTLPLSLALDPDNAESDALCSFEEGRKNDPHCPRSSIVGKAVARTPLLNRPLKGNVYFVKNVRFTKAGRAIRTLPTLLLALRGEVSLNVRARTDVDSKGRLVTTFPVVPDAPVSRFDLSLKGGKKGILTVSQGNICRGRQVTAAVLNGHNGKRSSSSVAMRTPCGKKRG
jgi:hypothetical protein